MTLCEETLGPGLAAYQELTDAGKFCELAAFDEDYEQWKSTPEAARELANALKQPSPMPVGK